MSSDQLPDSFEQISKSIDAHIEVVDEILAEVVRPLIPSWSVISVDDYCNAIGLLASLEGGVVVGDLRIAITVTPYMDDDEYDT